MSGVPEATRATSRYPLAPPEVLSLIDQAWEIRTSNFPMEVTKVSPVRTQAVSVTGTSCALDCAHCGKHYLRGMKSLDSALQGQCPPGTSSFLVSGGSTPEGCVPLMEYLKELHQLKEQASLNLHTGLVDRKEALALGEVAQVVSFDFPASTQIIQQVYGLDRDFTDYVNSYRILADCLGPERVVPHLTIGLMKGEISQEVEAARILAAERIKSLVFLVFIPTPGTRFSSLDPPDIWKTAAVMAEVRTLLPEVPITLGCMRPGGRYRLALDEIALRCGINKIVNPPAVFEDWARELNLDILYEEECCAL